MGVLPEAALPVGVGLGRSKALSFFKTQGCAPSSRSESDTGVTAQGSHSCPLAPEEGDIISLSWEQPQGPRV